MDHINISLSSSGDTCAAWLFRPSTQGSGDDRPRPIIVMAHGLGGVKEERLDAFAAEFAAAGYLCLVFDYRHFGASGGQPRQLLDVRRQREDWKAAVAFARTIEGADPDRVILWGTSFSGGHVIVTAAEDPRIAAVIAQCPFTDGVRSSLQVPPLTSLKLTRLAVADLIGAARGREPVTVPSYGPPGTTAFMTAPDVVAGQERLLPPGFAGRKDLAARFALDLVRQTPGRRVKDVRCPIFVAICERDSVAPARPTQRYAAQAKNGEVRLYDAGHFDIYVGEAFRRNVADQLDFLARHVPVA